MLGRRVFAFLYLIQAACGFSFQLIWIRWVALALGSTALAFSCELSAFMGGMGLGAWAASRVGERIQKPMKAAAGIQAWSGTAAFLPFLSLVFPSGSGFLFAFFTVAVAAFPLGWAFPLASKIRSVDGTHLGNGVGGLYALDCAGALIGCVGAGLGLIPWVGLIATMTILVSGKMITAILLWGLRLPKVPEQPAVQSQKFSPNCRKVLFLVAMQGFSILAAEALWGRMLSFVLYRGSTTYAAISMLGSVLGFSALGAAFSGFQKRALDPNRGFKLASGYAVAGGFSLLLSLGLLLVVGPVPSRGPLGAVDLLVTFLAVGPASFFSAAVFSVACRMLARSGHARGPATALSLNTAAGVCGALLVPLVAVPHLGLGMTLGGLAVLLVMSGCWMRSDLSKIKRMLPGLCALAIATLLWLEGPRWVRHLGQVIFYRDGFESSVAVTEDGVGLRRLYVDGVAVAGTDLIMSTDQKSLAHLPVMLHRNARSVLTVGFGSGGSSYSLLRHPELSVDCMEISSTVVQAAVFLKAANHGVLEHPNTRYHLLLGDARSLLRNSNTSYDVVINDCTDLMYRGDAALYSLDFFKTIQQHLNSSGICATWIPLRGQAPFRVLQSVIRTFGEVFPNISLWVFDSQPVHFGILIGTSQNLSVDFSKFRAGLKNPQLTADLEEIGLADVFHFGGALYFNDRSLRQFSKTAPIHSDDLPVVEFLAARESGDDASAYDFLQSVGFPDVVPLASGSPEDRKHLADALIVRPFLMAGHRAYLKGAEDLARELYMRALRLDLDDPVARTLLGIPQQKVSKLQEQLKHSPKNPEMLLELATIHLIEGDYSQSRALFSDGLEQMPRDGRMLLGMGMVMLQETEPEPAAEFFRRAYQFGSSAPIRNRAALGLSLTSLPGPLFNAIKVLTLAGL